MIDYSTIQSDALNLVMGICEAQISNLQEYVKTVDDESHGAQIWNQIAKLKRQADVLQKVDLELWEISDHLRVHDLSPSGERCQGSKKCS